VTRRALGALGSILTLWVAVACLDISSPVTGIASITSVILPTPSVVVNDTLRDTLGQAQPLRVYAFAPNGDTVKDAVVRFFAIDATHKLRVVDSITGFVVGDSLSPSASVVARVTPAEGKGVIQTQPVRLPVVPMPASATRSNDTTFSFDPSLALSDTLATTLLSPPLTVKVYGNTTDTIIQSYVVSYKVVRAPISKFPGEPTVVVFDRSGNDSTVAITDGSGLASRQLRIRLHSIPDALKNPGASDVVVVQVRVLYRGVALPVTPTDSFTVTLRALLP
jgi:hypothetical protein